MLSTKTNFRGFRHTIRHDNEKNIPHSCLKKFVMGMRPTSKAKEGDSRAADIIKNWIRNRATLEFLGTWEEMYNPDFKVVEFDHFKMQAGLPSFVLSPGQWIKKTSAVGMYVRSGR
ncbi:MAG: KilA-N domain-containing protein [Desulfobacterales bacterium]|nr:KilA-N domain-containing protein [Desulfobacterales bacterium]